MESPGSNVALRIRVTDISLLEFKRRAVVKEMSTAAYADAIFHYLLPDRIDGQSLPGRAGQNLVYFELQVPRATRNRLRITSDRQVLNLAAFSGALIEMFLSRYDRDPRDLAMIHYLSVLLDQSSVVTESDLRTAITRCETTSRVHLPSRALSRWLYGRLVTRIQNFQRDETIVPLTAEIVEELLRT